MPKRPTIIAGALIAASLLLTQAHAESHPTFFLGAGATGTNASGFKGGYGFSGGAEIPLARNADLVVRGDYHAVPADPADMAVPVWMPVHTMSEFSAFGNWPQGAARVDRFAVLSGIRIHPPQGAVRSYLDVLVGVGNVRQNASPGIMTIQPFTGPSVTASPPQDDTNIAMSFGAGLAFPSPLPGSMFLDAHYDFYYVGNRVTPIIPIRLGMRLP